MTTKLVDNPRYAEPEEKVETEYAPESIKPKTADIWYEKINSGPNKGFYRRVPPYSLRFENEVYSKVYLQEPLRGPYHDYMFKRGDFYYVPREDQIDIRRLIFGLRKRKMPTTGNVEKYNLDFNDIQVPVEFCPVVDPCNYEWCEACQSGVFETKKAKRVIKLMNLFYFMIFLWIVSNIVLYGLFG